MKTKMTCFLLYAFVYSLMSCSQYATESGREASPRAKGTRPEEAFPLQRGISENGTLNGQNITYDRIDGQAVFQSDILIKPDSINGEGELHTEGTGRSRSSARWPGKIVYYVIDPALPDRARVADAIAHWEANTSIRFVLRTTQRGYVLFRPGAGCSSNVGYIGTVQYINLASACTTGNTIHEIGHTIGLWHEQSRADRDSYVTVYPDNVLPGYTSDFETYAQRGMDGFDFKGGLDFRSIMLYGSYDFSRNGLPTMTRKDGATFMSQRQGLSMSDIHTVEAMYP